MFFFGLMFFVCWFGQVHCLRVPKLQGRGGLLPLQPSAHSDASVNINHHVKPNKKNNRKLLILFDPECVSNRDEVESILSSIKSQYTCLQEDVTKHDVIYYNSKLNQYHAYLKVTDNGNCLDLTQIDYEHFCIEYFDYEPTMQLDSLSCSEDIGSYANLGSMGTKYMWNLDAFDGNLDKLSNLLISAKHEVDVYVVDTGILSTHREFKDLNIIRLNDDFYNDDVTKTHGTMVAGTIIGQNVGIARGIQNVVTLFDIPSLRHDGEQDNALLKLQDLEDGAIAVLKNLALRGTQRRSVINLSLGVLLDDSYKQIVADTYSGYIEEITTKYNAIIVASAGNEGVNACNHFPSFLDDVISVGASHKISGNLGAASFSNYGECVDIYAPGTFVLSSSIESNNAYDTTSGTSFSAPYVSGIITQMLAINNKLTLAQILELLKDPKNTVTLDENTCQSGGTIASCKQIQFDSCKDMFDQTMQKKYVAICDINQEFTWYEANAYCAREFGTSLASIHSNEDNAALKSIRTKRDIGHWMGLRSIENMDGSYDYFWSDGSSYDYELDWKTNNPNYPTKKNCISLRWNKYDDISCWSGRQSCFVCNSA